MGKVMSLVQPRHAVAYHFFNEAAIRYGIFNAIRETYSGPLSMATDMMVWNVTKEKITERMAVSPSEAWGVPGPKPQQGPEKGLQNPMSQFIDDGRLDVRGVEKKMLDAWAEKYNLQSVDWRKKD